MSIVILNHKVQDFNKWKPIFEKDAARRNAAGLKLLHLARKESDPNDVYMIYETNDVVKAQQMMQDPGLQQKMKEAGVISTPTINILKKV